MTKRSDAYNQGFISGYEYVNGDCPYRKSQQPDEWEDWLEGWQDGSDTYNEAHYHRPEWADK